jgi:DNA-binding IclR family transcriptional regulator
LPLADLDPARNSHEELFYADEEILETSYKTIKRTARAILTWSELKSALDHLRSSMYAISDDEVRLLMQGIIPEYLCPPRKIFAMAARAGGAEAMASGD